MTRFRKKIGVEISHQQQKGKSDSVEKASFWWIKIFLCACLLWAGCSNSNGEETSLSGTQSAGTDAHTGTSTQSTEVETGTQTSSGSNSTDPTSSSSPDTETQSSDSDDSDSDDTVGTETTDDIPCEEGTIICEEGTAKVCDGMGGFESEDVCPEACSPGLGCTLCLANSFQCVDGQSQQCPDDGMGWEDYESCDPIQGLSCNQDSGQCEGTCSKQSLAKSYIGCEYYPTILQQSDGVPLHEECHFVIAVSNTSNQSAHVLIERAGQTVVEEDIPAGEAKTLILPWVDELALGNGPSVIVEEGAYHLRSNQPVTVYQYNPIENVATNDASLLLPVSAWTGNYIAASWPSWQSINNPMFNQVGFYAVVAHEDTTISLSPPTQAGNHVQAGAGVNANGMGNIQLKQGDVLQVMAMLDGKSDLTGTLIEADRPVGVFGGHECTQVPKGVEACDHLEEMIFPLETLAHEYLVVPTVQTPNDQLEKGQVVRVIATENNTTLVFKPDQGVMTTLANRGDFVEIPPSDTAFLITSDKRILVVQYMVGQLGGFGDGDPSMLLAINSQQWRDDYLVYAPIMPWNNKVWNNYVDLISKEGVEVTLDDVPAGNWKKIANTGFVYTHVKLSNNGNGVHSIAANGPVGVNVYGLSESGSYWYPGGLDLNLIPR